MICYNVRAMRNQTVLAVAVAAVAMSAMAVFGADTTESVRVRHREIAVSVIGLARPSFRLEEASVSKVIDYWTAGMDKEIANRPDLIVLPEGCDMLSAIRDANRAKWVRMRGTKIQEALQAYAAEHRCYIVYSAHRLRDDGRFANSCILIDRAGKVVAIYDKCFPMTTEMENKEFPIVPGSEPVVVETDFGRLGFAICFDLNFPELMRAYAAKKPDVIAFVAAFDGDFLQRSWAHECQSYVVSSTTGPALPDRVIDPAGGELRNENYYMPTFTAYINTNCRVMHLDFNRDRFPDLMRKYGRRVTIRNPGSVGAVTLVSNDPDLPVDSVMKEFNFEPLTDYLARARRIRMEHLPPAKGSGKP